MAVLEEQEYNRPFDLKVWRRMLPYIRPYRVAFFSVVAFLILSAVVDILLPLFQRYAIDRFITAGSLEHLGAFTGLYVLVIAFQVVLVILAAQRSMFVELNVGRDLKREMFLHLQRLSFSYYNVTPVGYILSRVISDTDRISATIAWGLVDIFWALCYVAGVFLAMLLLDVKLALLVMLVIPAIALLTFWFQNRILHWNRRVRRVNSRITSAFNEGIMGVKAAKTLGMEERSSREFAAVAGEMRRSAVRAATLNGIYIPIILFCGSVTTALVLARGGYLVLDGLMQLGTLSAFTAYAVGIFEPVQQLARVISDLIAAQANIERITGLLDEQPGVLDTPKVVEQYGDTLHPKRENWEPLRGEIEFCDVTFRYPDGKENVLEHFNLKIPAGTNVALVGETGAGKSTLVNLACRFFEPTEGRILIDGVDYRERSQLWLHSNIGYVLQNPHLFSGTVMENIRYGRLDATDREVIEAAERVSADTVVRKLEQGYQSDVGEGGDRLSTGEKQLISFARAVLADPRIFVLDEATSSIDTQTEQLIQQAISQLLHGRTSFLIAHRLSTIRQADLILVVKDGRIIERGTHQELLAQKGAYHDLYSRQFEEEAALRALRRREG